MHEATFVFLHKLVDAWNTHDVDRIAGFYAPEYLGIDVGDATPQTGRSGIRRAALRYMAAFPDLHLRADELIIEGDRVAVMWTARGTHRGMLMSIPPSGRTVEVRGISMLTVRESQIVRAFTLWDVAGLLRALGLLPELAATP
jgi:steroid delta-isomerase-like uncharacterized protein